MIKRRSRPNVERRRTHGNPKPLHDTVRKDLIPIASILAVFYVLLAVYLVLPVTHSNTLTPVTMSLTTMQPADIGLDESDIYHQ